MTTDSLTSDWFLLHTRNAVEAKGETLEYFIYNDTGYINFEDGTWGYSVSHKIDSMNFIRDSLSRIDEYIDLDFKEAPDWSNSTFDIYCLSSFVEWDADTLGMVNGKATAGDLIGIYFGKILIDPARLTVMTLIRLFMRLVMH